MILTKATGEQITLQERLLELVHVDALLVHYIFRRPAREESGKPVVEIDKILGDTPALRLVRLQDRSISNTVDHSSQLPAEIVSILHADVHTLASLGTAIDQYGSCTHLKGLADLTCECVQRRQRGKRALPERSYLRHAVRFGMRSTNRSICKSSCRAVIFSEQQPGLHLD